MAMSIRIEKERIRERKVSVLGRRERERVEREGEDG
jgi:hypothetical protein